MLCSNIFEIYRNLRASPTAAENTPQKWRNKMTFSSQKLSGDGQPTIPDYKIRDFLSFNEATNEPRQIAGLYFFMMLDCIVDLAYAVSHDFFERPHLYTDLNSDVVGTLAKLKGQYGFNEFIVAKDHRQSVYSSIFGNNELGWMHNQGDFARYRNNFLEAVSITVERPEFIDAGFVALENRILRTHRDFKQYLTGFLGGSIRWSRDQSLATLTEDIAYLIIRDPGISSIFGVIGEVAANYPYDFDPTSNGDKVLANISYQLMVHNHTDMHITRQLASNLIRAAQTGAEALATIIDFSEEGSETNIQLLSNKSYNWYGALINLGDYPSTDNYHSNSEESTNGERSPDSNSAEGRIYRMGKAKVS